MTKSYNMGYVPDEKNVDDTDGVIVINKKDSPGATNGTSKLNGASNGYHNDGDAVRFQEVDLEDQPDGNKKPKDDVVKPKGATLAEMYSFATGLDKLLMLGGSLAALAHGAAWPLMMLVFGKMTDDFVYYNANTTDPNFNISSLNISFDDIAEQFEDNMTSYSLQYVYIGIGVGIGTYVQITFWQMACERQTYKLRLAFFKSLLRQNIGWYDKQQSGDLTTKLASDLEKVREGLGDKVALALQFMAQFVAGFALGFSKGWKMTLIMMSLTPLLAILAAVLGKLTVSYSTLETLNYAKAGAIAEEVLSCIRTVTSFNGQVQAIKKYHQALSKCMKFGVKKSMFAGLSVGLMLFIMFCAYGLAFWYGSTQVDDYNTSNHEDGLSPGSVLAIFFSVMVGSFALGSASPHISSFLSAKGAGGTVFPIIQNKPSIDSSDTGGKKPSTISGRIQLRNVSFTYPTRVEAQILQDFDLDIEPGQTVALVGSSGCGKSTIVNLIQRFYDPDQGTITLDGEDIRDLNIHWLRGNIGIVSQEPILFGMSIADNIKLGKPGIAMEEIEKAARMANAHDFISSLPNKYDTLVGERGAQLSGGQKQRVAIARALVRDPRILLLDEATSALDSESEGIVQAALDKAGVGRTTVIIAHRLSTIQNADVIYVLEEGKVVEKGKHHDLMTNQGAYYKLVTLQMITAEKEEEESKDAISGASALRKRSINRQGSKQRSDSGPKAGLSTQLSTDSSTSRDVNLFRNAGKKPAEGEEEEEEENLELAGFGRIFKANLPEWPLIVFGCLAAMVNGAIFPAFSFIFSEIIKTFSKTGDELLDDGLLWSMLFVGLGGVAFVVNVIQNSAFGFSGERLTHRLRNEAFTNMVRQDIEYFDHPKHSTGALTTRLATDATIIKTATGIRLAMIVQSATSMIAGLTIAFVYGWKLAFAVLGGVPVIMAAGAINMRILKGNQLRDSSLLEEAGKVAGECVENIRTVQGLTREPYFYEYYAEKLMKPYKESLKQAHVYGISFAFSQSVFFFLYAAAYRFGAWLVVHDGMHPDLVFRVFFAITFTGMSVGQASSFLPEYAKAKLSASKIFKILDTIPKIDVYSTLGIKQVDQASANGKIEVKDVRFRYVTRPEVEVLKGVSIEVQTGQTAALVGISGCGKSTIMSLVQRFYDPESGSITVQGKDVKEYNLKSLRSLISVVSQEPILFDTTIRENIMYGLDTEMAMSDVIQAARTANAHNFISQLPDGYETTVGEKGTQLSGGQKQRVAIARALIRNPRILLLDEATSALDTESEKVVQEALDHARHGRTCIVIAHRLSTIQNADVIYVMEAGKVVESGTHQELLAKRGAYSVLVGGQRFKKEDDSKVDEADDEVN